MALLTGIPRPATTFNAGVNHLAFTIEMTTPVLTWHLDGTNVQATLDKSFRCSENMDEVLDELP